MATIKECDCIENVVRAISLATEMKDFSFFHIETGHDYKLKQLYSGTETVTPPKRSASLLEVVDKDANLLYSELSKLEMNCKFTGNEHYLDGKRELSATIISQGRNLTTAYISGTKIIDTLKDLTYRKKLLQCKD